MSDDEYAPAPAPTPPQLGKIWNVLELRILVLISLCLQVVLIVFGNRRKYTGNEKLRFFIWFTYLSADWIATVALGILSKDNKIPANDPNFTFMAVWAPFLLVHLGGPDTITAYSLEDNELWHRHFLALVYQLGVAVYVVYRSWMGIPLNYVTIPILFAGIIKYGERTWSLWCGSSKGFRDSILPLPDPGPNYAKFMDDYTAKKAEGYNVTVYKVNETTTPNDDDDQLTNASSSLELVLEDGFKFYNIIPKSLFADLILSFQDQKSSQELFQKRDWEHAFKVVEVELGIVYDKLYTKAVLTYSRRGFFLKFVSFFATLSALIAFTYLTVTKQLQDQLKNDDKGSTDIKGAVVIHYLKRLKQILNYDLVITFVLFIGAIALEIYAVIVLLCSDWAMLWLRRKPSENPRLVYLLSISIPWFQYCFKLSNTVRWSNRMSQFNLIRFCLKREPVVRCVKLQKLIGIYDYFEKSYYQIIHEIRPELKQLIFEQLKAKSKKAKNIQVCKILCAHRGDQVLENCGRHVPEIINQSITGVDFDQSILLWHIATDLLYCSSKDDLKFQSPQTSILLSDYMLDLLVARPFLLPNGIGQTRFKDTCAEVDELLKERKYISKKEQVCEMILRVNTEIPPSDVKGDRSKSVLFDACRLAKSLQSLQTEEGQPWTKEETWKMISEVWAEMLCHAASQCRELQHAKQLSQGGELLTHVWLLMAHLGITEQFQISQGNARAKLKLS